MHRSQTLADIGDGQYPNAKHLVNVGVDGDCVVQDPCNDDILARARAGQDKADCKGMSDVRDILPFSFLFLIHLVGLRREPNRLFDFGGKNHSLPGILPFIAKKSKVCSNFPGLEFRRFGPRILAVRRDSEIGGFGAGDARECRPLPESFWFTAFGTSRY